MTLARHGDQATAQQLLHKLLQITKPEGYIRTIVDEGKPMRSLIADLRSTITDTSLHIYMTQVLDAFPDKHPNSLAIPP